MSYIYIGRGRTFCQGGLDFWVKHFVIASLDHNYNQSLPSVDLIVSPIPMSFSFAINNYFNRIFSELVDQSLFVDKEAWFMVDHWCIIVCLSSGQLLFVNDVPITFSLFCDLDVKVKIYIAYMYCTCTPCTQLHVHVCNVNFDLLIGSCLCTESYTPIKKSALCWFVNIMHIMRNPIEYKLVKYLNVTKKDFKNSRK